MPIITARFAFLRLADQLVREGDKKKALDVLDKAEKVIPNESVPYDQLSANFTLFYYEVGDTAKAVKIGDAIAKRADEELTYFIEKSKEGGSREWGADSVNDFIQNNLRDLSILTNIATQNNKEAAERYQKIYDKHAAAMQ